jgi:hypothetical protein
MPGLEHAVSDMTKRTDADPYGCANLPRKDGFYATERVYHPTGSYNLAMVWVPDVMSKECRYDNSLTDSRCATCDKRGSGEQYDKMIRRSGK